MGWLLANLFLLSVVLTGAGYFWALGALVKWLALGEPIEPYAFAFVAVLSLLATYFTMKLAYGLIDRRMRRKA